MAEPSVAARPFLPCVCVHAKSLSRVWLFASPWTVAHQDSLSMGFSRQEYWSGLLWPPTGDLLDPGIEPTSPVAPSLQADSLPLYHRGKPFLPWLFPAQEAVLRWIFQLSVVEPKGFGQYGAYETTKKYIRVGSSAMEVMSNFFLNMFSIFRKLPTIIYIIFKRNLNSRWKTLWKRQWFFVETPGLLSSQETRRLIATYP